MIVALLAPAKEQGRCDNDESQRQSDPEPVNSPTQCKAKRQPEGEAENPISDEIGDHGRAGLAQAAERASGDGLNSVEDLKRGGYIEQGGAFGKNVGITRVEVDEGPWLEQKHDCREEHEAGAEGHGHPTGAAGSPGVAGPDRVAHANGRGSRHAKRHHVGDGGVVEGDGMRGQGYGVEQAGSEGGSAPGSHFENDLSRGGGAESHELADFQKAGTSPVAKQRMAPAAFVAPGKPDKRD